MTTSTIANCTKTSNTTTAYIGLPRYGEMFISQTTRGTKATFWLLTPYSNKNGEVNIRYTHDKGNAYDHPSTYTAGVRPTMYLKSTVKISSGNGTYESPYILTQ